VTEKAAIFGGVILGKGIDPLRGVTLGAEFFRLFFSHFLESAVLRILRQFFGSFFWGEKQKNKNSSSDNDEGNIEVQGLNSFAGS
jgi:hypothetical protein